MARCDFILIHGMWDLGYTPFQLHSISLNSSLAMYDSSFSPYPHQPSVSKTSIFANDSLKWKECKSIIDDREVWGRDMWIHVPGWVKKVKIFLSQVNTHQRIFFFFLNKAALCGMWDLSSLTRDRTLAPCSGSVVS